MKRKKNKKSLAELHSDVSNACIDNIVIHILGPVRKKMNPYCYKTYPDRIEYCNFIYDDLETEIRKIINNHVSE